MHFPFCGFTMTRRRISMSIGLLRMLNSVDLSTLGHFAPSLGGLDVNDSPSPTLRTSSPVLLTLHWGSIGTFVSVPFALEHYSNRRLGLISNAALGLRGNLMAGGRVQGTRTLRRAQRDLSFPACCSSLFTYIVHRAYHPTSLSAYWIAMLASNVGQTPCQISKCYDVPAPISDDLPYGFDPRLLWYETIPV